MTYFLLYLALVGFMLFWVHCATKCRLSPEEEQAEYDLQYEELIDPMIDNRTGRHV